LPRLSRWRADLEDEERVDHAIGDVPAPYGQALVGYNGVVDCYLAVDGKPLWKNRFHDKGSAPVALATPLAAVQADNDG
jgi:hypothetical protein